MAVSIKKISDLSHSTVSDAKLLLGEDASGNMVGVEPDFTSEVYGCLGIGTSPSEPRNLWNEEWEVGGIDQLFGNNEDVDDYYGYGIRSVGYIPVKSNTAYYVTYEYVEKYYYDEDKNYLGCDIYGNQFTTPANSRFLRIVGSNMPTEDNKPFYTHNIAIFEGEGGGICTLQGSSYP